ncbi:sensor histidine kinase [Mucilaginibacter pineti]|nr:ATP-binding protein [Mucilaginibacter pineti]
MLQTAPNIYLVLSPELYILTASNLYLEATETTRETIVGKHIFEAFPENPELPDASGVKNINASLQEVLRTGKPHKMRIQRYDVPDIHHPGKFITRYWDPSHTPVFDDNGALSYIIQLANNVTEQVLADKVRQKLEISERHFRLLADLVPAKISNARPNGEVTYFNQRWLDYAHLSFEELRDFGYYQMMHPDEIPVFTERLAAAAKEKKPIEMEMRFKNAAGDYRWHLNIASPVLDDNGEITMWVGSTTEIQRLKEDDQRKSDFIGMVSHELKTPLTSLTAILQVVETKLRKSDDTFVTGALEKANQQTKRMSQLINGFLNISRLESGKIAIERRSFLIGGLIREVIEEVSLAGTTHIFELQSCGKTVVQADQPKISSVLSNLLSNAVKYSPKGSRIWVSCEAFEGELRVSIADEGIGIRPEDREKIFERFYRVKSNSHISGFGIGLYLSAEIVEHHGGRIWVESETGKGSVFYFTLPLNKSAARNQ